MTRYNNSFEGGTTGSQITAASSGGVSGDAFTAVSGATTLYSNVQAAHGVLSMATSTTNASQGYIRWNTNTTATSVAARLYIYATGLPTGDEHLIRLNTGTPGAGTRLVSIHYNVNGNLRISDASGTSGVWTSTNTLPLNQWVRIELFAIAGSTTSNGTIKGAYYLGDSTTPVETLYSNTAANVGTAQNFTYVVMGRYSGAGTVQYYFDDLATDDAATGLIGPIVNNPILSVNSANVAKITASATSGTSPYTYSITQTSGTTTAPTNISTGVWTVTPPSTGTLVYQVSVTDANGVTSNQTITISPIGSTTIWPKKLVTVGTNSWA